MQRYSAKYREAAKRARLARNRAQQTHTDVDMSGWALMQHRHVDGEISDASNNHSCRSDRSQTGDEGSRVNDCYQSSGTVRRRVRRSKDDDVVEH